PQALALGDKGVPTEVVVVEELGSETFVFADVEHLGKPLRIRIRVDAEYAVARGDKTHVDVLGPVHVFGADGLRLKTTEEQQG
ncbi:MAG: sugar ABC transporter ATP-binding protein, partial [Chloroflexota bacterium]